MEAICSLQWRVDCRRGHHRVIHDRFAVGLDGYYFGAPVDSGKAMVGFKWNGTRGSRDGINVMELEHAK